MAQNCFHPSIEGAQHGAKSLAQFLEYAKKSGASGAQPSNYTEDNETAEQALKRHQFRTLKQTDISR